LPIARSAGDDDHVAGLEARGLHVEVVEAGRDAGDVRGMLAVVELLDAVHHLAQQRLDGGEALRGARAGVLDLEDLRLGLVEQPWPPARRIEGAGGDLVAHRHQLAQDGPLADDLGVALDVGGRRRVVGDLAEIGHAAGLLGDSAAFSSDSYTVTTSAGGRPRSAGDVAEDAAMVVAVEIASETWSAMRSQALLSSSRPPSSDCSASIECGGSRTLGHALRDQEIAGVAILDLDDVAEVAEVNHLVEQNDLHVSSLRLLMVVGVGQQGQEAGALDRGT
jgi:hypothetical protein